VLGTASTSQVLEWSCARKRCRANHDNRAARRALEQIGAVRVWRIRNSDEKELTRRL
jgi:RimJ/RimL family protein N-acetyltransferase